MIEHKFRLDQIIPYINHTCPCDEYGISILNRVCFKNKRCSCIEGHSRPVGQQDAFIVANHTAERRRPGNINNPVDHDPVEHFVAVEVLGLQLPEEVLEEAQLHLLSCGVEVALELVRVRNVQVEFVQVAAVAVEEAFDFQDFFLRDFVFDVFGFHVVFLPQL